MNEGISVNGAHSCGTFGLKCLKRSITAPKKDDYTERVPYSNVTYDFGGIYSGQSYGEAQLSYTFEFMSFHRKMAQDRIMNIKKWLHWTGSKKLCDDLLPSYYFMAREPSVSWSEKHGIYTISMIFPAAPEMHKNVGDEEVI